MPNIYRTTEHFDHEMPANKTFIIQREALAEMVRNYYRTAGDDRIADAAEDGLRLFDDMLSILQSVVDAADDETQDSGEGTVYFPYRDVAAVVPKSMGGQ